MVFLQHILLHTEYAKRKTRAGRHKEKRNMEQKKYEQKNWFNLTVSPSLYCRYAYIDLEDHLADSLFQRQNISVRFEREFQNPINGYRLIICKILPWHRDGFLKALSELPNKMNLLGFNDYQDFCRDYLDYSETWMQEKLCTA